MKFLADENFKFRLSKLLRGKGHDVKVSQKFLLDEKFDMFSANIIVKMLDFISPEL